MTIEAAYEIVWHPRTHRSFVYRSIRTGICGPWTTPTDQPDRQQAEAEALRYGITRTGPWTPTADGYLVATAEAITP